MTAGSFELVGMTEDDAVSLLRKLITDPLQEVEESFSEMHAKQVVRTLGFLPLAMTQAGSAIRRGLCRLEDFDEVFRKRERDLSQVPSQGHSDYRYTVYTTWEISTTMIL